jgi:bacteriorhodopsin
MSTVEATKVAENEQTISPKFTAVKMTFYLTYVLLLTTGTITIIEAISTSNPLVRHVMNIETCISVIAGYFYSQFVAKIEQSNGTINYKDINDTRYNDWFITTPLMILVVMLSLSYTTGHRSVHLGTFIAAILLNFGMLYSGYLGDKGSISKTTGCIVGFLFFVCLFGLIYINFVRGSNKMFNIGLFGVYVFLWSIYGVVYLLDEENKNIAYNVLDLVAKCFVGLGLWMYFTKILV